MNAVVSRQFRDAVPIVERLKAAGKLRRSHHPPGNNGILIDAADCDRISAVAGPNRTVYLVDPKIPRSFGGSRTSDCRPARNGAPTMLRWFLTAICTPCFAADGYHLTSTGQAKFAALLASKSA